MPVAIATVMPPHGDPPRVSAAVEAAGDDRHGICVAVTEDSFARSPFWKADKHLTDSTGTSCPRSPCTVSSAEGCVTKCVAHRGVMSHVEDERSCGVNYPRLGSVRPRRASSILRWSFTQRQPAFAAARL